MPSATSARWEYLTLKCRTDTGFFTGTNFDTETFDDQLNALGAKGWELVSIFEINRHEGGSKFVNAVLKRPVA